MDYKVAPALKGLTRKSLNLNAYGNTRYSDPQLQAGNNHLHLYAYTTFESTYM